MTDPFNFRPWARDTWERCSSTFIAAAVVWLVTFDRFDPTAHWVEALVAACVPPVLVLFMQLLPGLTYTGTVWWIDALTRVARSAVQGFVGGLLAGTTLLSVSTWHAAAVAAGMAALAAVKTIVARWKPGTVTPASLARLTPNTGA